MMGLDTSCDSIVVVPLNFLVTRALVAPRVALATPVGAGAYGTSLLQARRVIPQQLGRR